MIAIRARCCSPAIVGDEALKYPFGRAVQQGSSGSDNLTWHSEKNVVQQTMLETGYNEVVEVMTRCSAAFFCAVLQLVQTSRT